MRRLLYGGTLLAATMFCLVASRPALACGGLFCSSTSGVPLPVDQNAERILFEVHESTITAHIQIQYVGESEDFAWVVPVSAPGLLRHADRPTDADIDRDGLPVDDMRIQPRASDLESWRAHLEWQGYSDIVLDIAESSTDRFLELDWISTPTMVLPAGETCDGRLSGTSSSSASGCGGFGSSDEIAYAGSSPGDTNTTYDNGVTVFSHDVTENYEFHIVAAEETADLVSWLQDNGYNVSDNMTPVMDVYNMPGIVFLALKLRPERSVSDIVPIAITYEGNHPSIPIQLTAVAAQPLMGIQVYIVADRRYAPANYQMIQAAPREILFDELGNTSYFEWVARRADEANGQLFVGEYVGPTWSGDAVLSRYYTRLSAHQMTIDPVFAPSATYAEISNQVDLTVHPPPIRCGELVRERLPSPCAFNYCGLDATCTVGDEGEAGCDCPAGRVAQRVGGPDGRQRMTCIPAENPYGITAEAGGVFTSFNPCLNLDCGQGSCVLRSGFATCDCDEGAIAVVGDFSQPACISVERPETFGPGAGVESRGETAAATPLPQRDYATAGGSGLYPLLLAFGMLALWGAATRRRRAT